jgi:hypothetical protein
MEEETKVILSFGKALKDGRIDSLARLPQLNFK